MGKKAVVLSGGGARGAYQAGAWKALRELDYQFDIVTGTSVGALNAAMMASGDFDRAITLWQEISPEAVLKNSPETSSEEIGIGKWTLEFMEKAIRERSFDQTPLRALIEKNLDLDALYASPVELGIVATKHPSMETVRLYKNEIPKERVIDYLMASSACYPLMRAYKIGEESYIDGGFGDNMPTQMAIDAGAEEIVVINLDAIGVKAKSNRAGIRVTRVDPKEDLGFILDFNRNYALVNIERGYFDTMKAFSIYDGWLYNFKKGEMTGANEAFIALLEDAAAKAIPENNMGGFMKKHIAMNFIRVMAKGTSAITLGKGWVLSAADLTGRIFALDPQKVYTKAEFDRLLLQKLAALPHFDTKNGEDILRVLTDDALKTKYLYLQLRELFSGNSVPKALIFAADAAPKALLCAFYILSIT